MILLAALLVVCVTGVILAGGYLFHGILREERERTAHLLAMLEAKAAPQQFYSLDENPDDDTGLALVWDDTGLIARYVPVDEVI